MKQEEQENKKECCGGKECSGTCACDEKDSKCGCEEKECECKAEKEEEGCCGGGCCTE